MSLPTSIKYSNPIEREFEAWTVSAIERYFDDLGLAYAIWAVSPSEEATWPADEKLSIGSKVFGLQFKQTKLAKGVPAMDRITWSFHQPPGQFAMVKSHSDIFYCLPTFVNRVMRKRALDHCLFWRPDNDDKSAWYKNTDSQVLTKNNLLYKEMRWGLFIESVLNCDIGKKVTSASHGQAALRAIEMSMKEFLLKKYEDNFPKPIDTSLYAVAVQYES